MCASMLRPRLSLARLLFACVLIGITSSQSDQCETPNGKKGVCINIKQCPYIVDNLYAKVTLELKQYINSSVCDQHNRDSPQSERRICCDRPSCATEGGLAGACVEPQMCRTQYQKTRGTCSLQGSVCCPRRTHDGYISRITGLPEYGFCGNVADKLPKPTGTALRGQSPWAALLVYRSQDSGQARETEKCGGALISARAVVTAAHCIDSTLVKVRLGVHKLTEQCTDVWGGCPFVSNVASVATEPSYDKTTGKNDIAVVTMATPAPYTDHIRPICLPPSNFDIQYLLRQVPQARTAGWGVSQDLTGNELVVAEDTQGSAELPMRNESVCLGAVDLWAQVISPYQSLDFALPANSLCAGGTFGGELCIQDSGGPLVYSQSGQHILLAVQSKFIAGCRAPVPAVYASVTPHVKWISKYLASYYNKDSLRKESRF